MISLQTGMLKEMDSSKFVVFEQVIEFCNVKRRSGCKAETHCLDYSDFVLVALFTSSFILSLLDSLRNKGGFFP